MCKLLIIIPVTCCFLACTIVTNSFAGKLAIANKSVLSRASAENVAEAKSEEPLIRDTVIGTVEKIVTPMLVQVESSGVNNSVGSGNIMGKVEVSCVKTSAFSAGDKDCKVKCKKHPYGLYEVTIYGDVYTGSMGVGWANRDSMKELLEYAVETGNFDCR